MLDLIIKNGQCYIDGELKNLDVAIKNGKIQQVGNISEKAKEEISANDQNHQISSKENNLVLEIERLADLRERGLLTDQEFTIAKRKLLS